MLVQEEIAQLQTHDAMQRYHCRYSNHAFTRATEGKSNAYANALIDEALAICGHPYYKLSRRRWAPAARAFLEHFGGMVV